MHHVERVHPIITFCPSKGIISLWNNETQFMRARNANGTWANNTFGWTEGDDWVYIGYMVTWFIGMVIVTTLEMRIQLIAEGFTATKKLRCEPGTRMGPGLIIPLDGQKGMTGCTRST
jgi:hypothetical protein